MDDEAQRSVDRESKNAEDRREDERTENYKDYN